MAKIIKTLRNNWKKSVFFSIVGAYGVNYGIERYKERELMRSYCKEALAYGEMTQSLTIKPYHVTVILNPAAHSGKARNKFENFCEPLLHLAGIKVRTHSIYSWFCVFRGIWKLKKSTSRLRKDKYDKIHSISRLV